MKYIDLTLPSPVENLACDEALLAFCEDGQSAELLRFWEAREQFVVVGYSNEAAREVKLDDCRAANIPVLRRSTGGGTVLQGPGCLNYSLFLRITESGPLHSIKSANTHILEKHQAALTPLLNSAVAIRGQTDLALGELKFSGNAQRRRRAFLIFHGTFLLDFDIASVGKFLHPPSKQPDYRQSRSHADFLTNIPLKPDVVKTALRKIWRAEEAAPEFPLANLPELVVKYSSDNWNFKF